MLSSSSAAILAIVGLASALPDGTLHSTPSPPYSPSWTLSASYTPCPTASACSTTPIGRIIRPSVTSQYKVSTGAVQYKTQNGKIFKDGRTTDVTTLLTFEFPAASEGEMCSFHFNLSPNSMSKVSGTGQFDVFTSIAPGTRNTTTWPSGNLRDQHIGRMTAQRAGEATWVRGFPIFGESFPCPAAQVYGGELVGVGDADHVEWLSGASGPYISW